MSKPATDELRENIKLILSQINPREPAYTLRSKKLFGPGSPPNPSDPPFIVTDPTEVEMGQQQVGLLRRLCGQCSPEGKSSFLELLMGEVTENNAFVVVLTLIHTGHLAELMTVLLGKVPAEQIHLRQRTWVALHEAISFEPHRFTEDDLTKLEEFRKRDATWAAKVEEAIVNSRPRPLSY